MKTKMTERIATMRDGGKIKCPKCEDGYITALGNPKTTNVFKCEECGCSFGVTVQHKIN